MSFSSEVKQELAMLAPDSACCAAAQAYGMLEFGHRFSPAAVSLQTEHAPVAERYEQLVNRVCGTSLTLTAPEVSGMYTVTADGAVAPRILSRFGHEGEVNIRLNRANLECDACAAAYVRGAFLVCGAITNPQVDYHLEFSVPYYHLSHDLMTLLGELGLLAKSVRRKGNYIVYFKESEQIEDCLTLMGAVSASLEMMNVKMVKSIRNNVNRVNNCETANIDKTVAAAGVQLEAVRRIESTVGLDSLPADLQELCRLRLENPEYSLRDLGACFEPPLSRSGVNHRFQRIFEIAENL